MFNEIELNNNLIALSNEELTNVDGGGVIEAVAVGVLGVAATAIFAGGLITTGGVIGALE